MKNNKQLNTYFNPCNNIKVIDDIKVIYGLTVILVVEHI